MVKTTCACGAIVEEKGLKKHWKTKKCELRFEKIFNDMPPRKGIVVHEAFNDETGEWYVVSAKEVNY